MLINVIEYSSLLKKFNEYSKIVDNKNDEVSKLKQRISELERINANNINNNINNNYNNNYNSSSLNTNISNNKASSEKSNKSNNAPKNNENSKINSIQMQLDSEQKTMSIVSTGSKENKDKDNKDKYIKKEYTEVNINRNNNNLEPPLSSDIERLQTEFDPIPSSMRMDTKNYIIILY